ncbi:MAG: NADH-quinone oxidoreductase subunit C [Proteobacteria bacterium]|nr:NADH-quinone oxidoreductase subunit C [Pseudomonadota bacterium]
MPDTPAPATNSASAPSKNPQLGKDLLATLAKFRHQTQAHLDEVVITCPLDEVLAILTALKSESGGSFTQLSDLTAVDYPQNTPRFQLVYQLLSVSLNQRLRLITTIGEGEVAPSVTSLFAAAIWAEREVWDMFGIFFEGHSDLRRLLTDYGFEGHPLRKDFPLTGRVEVRYDVREGRVVYQPVELTQEYRDFDFESPWEGMQTAMRNPPSAIPSAIPKAIPSASPEAITDGDQAKTPLPDADAKNKKEGG